MKFSGLYGLIAVLHGLVLLMWTGGYGFGFRLGFFIETARQMPPGYLGSNFIVFKL